MLFPEDRKDNLIHLPVNLVFTPDGVATFQASKLAVKRVPTVDSRPGQGLTSATFNAPTVQKLVFNGHLEEIYSTQPELLRYRNAIIDTTKLVTFGILYKKLNPTLGGMLLDSAVLRDYNRKNARNQIKGLNSIDRNRTRLLRQAKKDDFDLMELELRNEIVQKIVTIKGIEEEDRLLRMRSLDKFIAYIDERIWYLYYIIYQTPMRDQILAVFADIINNYLDRTRIATQLAVMLMESVQNSEKAHFERLVIKSGLARRETVDLFLKKKENRQAVVELARRNNENIDIAWRFDSGTSVTGKPYKIELRISNFGLISAATQQMLASKMKTETKGLSLSDFYNDTGENDKLGAGLGLLYMSYLEAECKAANLQFQTLIFPEPRAEKTTLIIQIIF